MPPFKALSYRENRSGESGPRHGPGPKTLYPRNLRTVDQTVSPYDYWHRAIDIGGNLRSRRASKMARETTTSTATPPVSFEDEALVEQARAGDVAAFGRLVSRYQDRVLNTCWRLCGKAEDAEDLAQETFLHALEAMATFQARSRFYTWIYRIAVNVALTHRRKQARAVKLSLHTPDGQFIGDQAARLVGRVSPESTDPSARLSARETQRRIEQGLEELDDDHRAVVVLRDIEGLEYEQIAEILEVAVGTVKSRLHRGRMELRRRLKAVVE